MDATSGKPATIPGISKTTGSLFFGIVMNWGLFGVLTVQLYIWYLHSAADKRWIKSLVYIIYFLEVAQTVLCTVDGFHWFVFGWGDPEQLKKPLASSVDSPFLDSMIALLVQTFFCWRIFIFSGNRLYSLFLVTLSFVQCGAGMASGIISVLLNDLTRVRGEETVPVAIWLASSVVVDTLIAISTCYLLIKQGRGLPSGDFITKIVRLTVETNAVTAGVAILTLALFIIFPHENYFVCPPYIFGKLYSNTLLVIFNNRIMLTRDKRKSVVVPAYNFGSHSRHDAAKMPTHNAPHGVMITVHQATMDDSDRPQSSASDRAYQTRFSKGDDSIA